MEREKETSSPVQSFWWPLALLGILGLWTWSKLKTPPQQSINSISPTANTGDKNEGRNSLSALQPQIPPAPTDPENTCKCCQHKTPWWKKMIEIGTLLVAIGAFAAAVVYACITYRMWQAMLETNRFNGESLTISQRAYITIGRPDGAVADIIMPKNPGDKTGILVYSKTLDAFRRNSTGATIRRWSPCCPPIRRLLKNPNTTPSGATLQPIITSSQCGGASIVNRLAGSDGAALLRLPGTLLIKESCGRYPRSGCSK